MKKVVIFAVGALVGAWLMKTYDQYKARSQQIEEEEYAEDILGSEEEEADDILDNQSYRSEEEPEPIHKDAAKERKRKPEIYIVEEETVDDFEGNCITLHYYADGILADDGNVPIEDAEKIVGEDALVKFMFRDIDSLYVKNERLNTIFEILWHPEEYSDIFRTS